MTSRGNRANRGTSPVLLPLLQPHRHLLLQLSHSPPPMPAPRPRIMPSLLYQGPALQSSTLEMMLLQRQQWLEQQQELLLALPPPPLLLQDLAVRNKW